MGDARDQGFIETLETLGLEKETFDVVISNCVVNLSIDKLAVLKGVFDLLKPGGEFYFADVSEAARNKQSMDVSERIQDEDHSICESVQKGLGSSSYDRGRYSVKREQGELHFHRLLAEDFKAAF